MIVVICSIVVGACKFVLECANGSSGPNGPSEFEIWYNAHYRDLYNLSFDYWFKKYLGTDEFDKVWKEFVHRDRTQGNNTNQSNESRDSGTNQNSESDQTGIDTEYSRALTILGLFNTPTKSELNKAYKKLIRKYHPDNGGSEEMCMQLNQARDYVAKYNGWE